ncbi:MAG: hypothetical protein IB616_05030 [Methanosarcinales archaeon]|nr:MAG: hypothetical protein IB616_05030 [Methanosarcinales archaeon]
MTAFKEVPEFAKDVKKLSKKYRHFDKDFERFKKALNASLPNHLRRTIRIAGLGHDVKTPVYKVKTFKSSDFKGRGARSGFRIIYAHQPNDDCIIFIEAYHKNKQENESRDRIYRCFGKNAIKI